MKSWLVGLVIGGLVASANAAEGPWRASVVSAAKFEFGGVIGPRVERNLTHWLIRAPQANPGLLAMFRQRDRQPTPELVPWAGEFVGKYLTSGVLAMRMTDDPALKATLQQVVDELLAAQADDGYLGPFRRGERLLGHWDLWGHYHVMLGLMLWHDATGDDRALAACRRAADLTCRIYLDGNRRMLAAGSPEMNLSMLHGLALLYQRAREPRYLRMCQEIVKDFEASGDYLRTGLNGVEYFRTPKPRWESLHCLQGLAEMHRITGDERFRRAFLHHWNSIRRYDRRNSGAFSSGEQATGDPFADTAIETCCTIAWMAITIDALRLTGDAAAADELELSTFNAVAGAQHPSGSWWTYDTPMNGRRKASAHDIVFQARAGTPELNCCSVNGPRGLGMLAEWAVMLEGNTVVVNFYGPMRATLKLPDGTPVRIEQVTDYPVGDTITLKFSTTGKKLDIKLRNPAWSRGSMVAVGDLKRMIEPGGYQLISIPGGDPAEDEVKLKFDLSPRYAMGAKAQRGRVSIYRGPLLLAFDPRFNTLDEPALPAIDVARLTAARVATVPKDLDAPLAGKFAPWLFVDVPTTDGNTVRLCDFASAGSTGTQYRSWLPAKNLPPAPPTMRFPRDGAKVPPGAMLFGWRSPEPGAKVDRWELVVYQTAESPAVMRRSLAAGQHVVIPAADAAVLKLGKSYRWQIEPAAGAWSEQERERYRELAEPARRFAVDASLRARTAEDIARLLPRADGLLLDAPLRADVQPTQGQLLDARGWQPADGRDGQAKRAVALDGKSGLIRYELLEFPARDYTFAAWVMPTGDTSKLHQIASAWCGPLDDPLRVCIENGKLFARIEAGRGYTTAGVPVKRDTWQHVAVVKSGDKLTLYIDGQPTSSAKVPETLSTAATTLGLGGNPNYTGNPEFLAARLSHVRLLQVAANPEEIMNLVSQTK